MNELPENDQITGIDQKTFNDELFDAYRKFITWDMERVRIVSQKYVNQHTTQLISEAGGKYRIAESKCPQNYGYNAIKLDVPIAGTEVKLQFKGLSDVKGYRILKAEKAGWRYGFLAVKSNGERVYGVQSLVIRFILIVSVIHIPLGINTVTIVHQLEFRSDTLIEQLPRTVLRAVKILFNLHVVHKVQIDFLRKVHDGTPYKIGALVAYFNALLLHTYV